MRVRGCAVAFVTSGALAAGAPAAAQDLPAGAGRDLVIGACTVACHGTAPIANTRQTRSGWQALVEDMIARGATVRRDDVSRVVDYLAQQLGRDASSRPSIAAGDSSASAAARPTLTPLPAHGPIDWTTA